jgi:diacylglycerol kinase (ATP)
MTVCPAADAADGRFDVTGVGPMTRLELVRGRACPPARTWTIRP